MLATKTSACVTPEVTSRNPLYAGNEAMQVKDPGQMSLEVQTGVSMAPQMDWLQGTDFTMH